MEKMNGIYTSGTQLLRLVCRFCVLRKT